MYAATWTNWQKNSFHLNVKISNSFSSVVISKHSEVGESVYTLSDSELCFLLFRDFWRVYITISTILDTFYFFILLLTIDSVDLKKCSRHHSILSKISLASTSQSCTFFFFNFLSSLKEQLGTPLFNIFTILWKGV